MRTEGGGGGDGMELVPVVAGDACRPPQPQQTKEPIPRADPETSLSHRPKIPEETTREIRNN